MAICKQCGKKYSIWTAQGLGTGLCNECLTVQSAKEAEEKKRIKEEAWRKAEEEAKATLPALFASYVPGENAKVLGVAYWNTLSSVVGTGVAKLVFGGLFGWLGMALSGTEHRAGIIAVSDNHLVLVDICMIVGSDLTLKKLRETNCIPSVKKVPLRNLTAEFDDQHGILALKGELKLKAAFPKCFEKANPTKAALIAKAIQQG